MSLISDIQRTGQYPPVSINIFPLNGSNANSFLSSGSFLLKNFIKYDFTQSVLVPASAFSFSFAAPDDPAPFQKYFSEGDVVQLSGNKTTLATGLIDEVEVENDADGGEMVSVHGRDLLGQFVDQDAISMDSKPFWGNKVTIQVVFNQLQVDTRIKGLSLQQAPGLPYLFATEPADSKMTCLQRFLEPLNCIAWMLPDGTLRIGRPNMAQASTQSWYLIKAKRIANVMNIKSSFAAATIPNVIVPIFTSQENVTNIVGPQQAVVNASRGPNNLLQLGHRVLKTILWSSPDSSSAQDLSEVNQLQVAGGNLFGALAKREIAKQNVKEVGVVISVPGHYNDDGTPITIDSMAKITHDRGNLDENMYCHTVTYTFDPVGGQRTTAYFCKAGTIVGDIAAPPGVST